MKTGTFFVRVWRIISILGFLLSLFSNYISYPESVAVRFDEANRPTQTISRELIFYLATAIFIINNTLLRAVAKLFVRVPMDSLPSFVRKRWAAHRSELNEIIANWFSALASAVNTVVALGLFVLSSLNRADRSMPTSDYAWLLPVTTAIFIAVLVSLPISLLRKPREDA
jgi:hypothetical protein